MKDFLDGFIVLLFLSNLAMYWILQPISFVYLFKMIKQKRDLPNINKFLSRMSLMPFLTLGILALFDLLLLFNGSDGGFVTVTLHFESFIFSLKHISGLCFVYAWPIAASYFILYFFNKENKLGIYIYSILFIMFILVIFERVYNHFATGSFSIIPIM